MTNQADSEWFLRNDTGDLGPLCEAAMREHVEQSTDPDLLIRQGNSDWRSVEVIRAKIRQLKENGIFVRYKKVAEGPFTLTRAHELLHQMASGGIEVQTGSGGDWIPAAKWLEKIDKLRKSESRNVDSLTAAVQQVLNRRGIRGIVKATGELDLAPDDRMVETAPQPAPEAHPQPLWLSPEKPEPIVKTKPIFEAEVILEAEPIFEAEVISQGEPVIEVVKELRSVHTAKRSRAVSKGNRVPVESAPRNKSLHGGASVHATSGTSSTPPTIVRAQSTVRNRPINRTSRKNNALSGRKNLGIGALAIVAIICVAAAGLLWPEKSVDQSSTASQTSIPSRLAPAPAATPAATPASTPASTPEQATVEPSDDTTVDAPEPAVPIPPKPPTLQSPLTIPTGMLFRPQFGTSEGEARAGTAFAAKLAGSSEVLIVSALNLFGPAGGLKKNIQADQLVTAWKKLVVEDCKSQNYFGEIGMQPIDMAMARPHPEKSDLGDIVICRVTDPTEIEALPLSQRVPSTGERVWLVSKVTGSGSLMHPATIERLKGGWLYYRFDDSSINLQATSGAPIVDHTGSVVAVNASSTKNGGKTIGSGTPVFNFYPTLVSRLR